MVQMSCGDYAYARLKTDGSIVAWGMDGGGGNTQGKNVTGVAQVVCGGQACARLKTYGLVVVGIHRVRT